MSDSLLPSHQPSTPPERAQYWWDVRREARELSQEQFQRHHELGIGIIALAIMWYRRGWDEFVNELTTSLIFVVAPVVLYLLGLYVYSFAKAMVRVPVSYQREVAHLKQELKVQPDPARDRKRERLFHFVGRGEIIVNQCRVKAPTTKIDESFDWWEAEVLTYLENFSDADHINSFLNINDIPISPGVAAGIAEEDKQTYLVLYSRIIRLRQFLEEVEKG